MSTIDEAIVGTKEHLEKLKGEAKEKSKEGYVVHINKDDKGVHSLSDTYASGKTVASFENGRAKNESVEELFFQIQSGELNDATISIGAAMAERIQIKLDDMKKEIAANLYKESVEFSPAERGTTAIAEGCISQEDKLAAVQAKTKSVPKKAPKLKDGDGKVVDDWKGVKEDLDEAKRGSNEGVYHDTYRAALEHSYGQAEKKGYQIHDEDYHKDTSFVDPKPAPGKTKSLHFPLSKNGVLQKKQMHVQVYNRGQESGSKYELNHYIS